MRITMIEPENANREAAELYEAELKKNGRVTNMKKTLLNDPDSFRVLMEWYPLRDRVAEIVGDAATDIFAYAVSSENDCLICSTFFRKIIRDSGRNPDDPELDETEELLAEYGRACAAHPVAVDDALFERMKRKFSEREIVLLTAFAGMMIATNLINNALDVPLDEYLTSYTKRK